MEQTVTTGMETIISNISSIVTAGMDLFSNVLTNQYMLFIFSVGIAGTVVGLVRKLKGTAR